MNTLNHFGRRLAQECALEPGSHVLLALSGGADSVALLCLLLEEKARYPFVLSCAHVEHGIRGEVSLEDAAFVQALCQEKNLPLYMAQVDAPGYARAQGCGLEEAARTLRYNFLYRTAKTIGADVIALAHHAGDQAETVLMHAMRGSDLRGLCAMRLRSGQLIRPLLDVSPQELRTYLASIGQTWREDASNADPAYLRNRIRHRILPEMECGMPGAGQALCRLSRAAQRDEDYFEQQLDALNLQWIPLTDGAAVRKAQLVGLHPAVLSRALVRMIAHAGIAPQPSCIIEEIAAALGRQDAVVNLTGGAHAVSGDRYLCAVRAGEPELEDTALNVPGVTDTPFGRFYVQMAKPGETGDGKYAQRMPKRLLEGACVTGRREGDAMIPFGRKTPVKLKKLMIDAGIERAMRKSIPVVRGRHEILFAVGLRAGESCRGKENEEQMIVRFLGDWPRADGK